ncbi:MAG: hypothetical protein V9E94_12140 [Microthrixaceae bacterium]
MTDHDDASLAAADGIGEKVEGTLVEMVRGFVEKEEVMVRSEQAGETDSVALANRHLRQASAPVGDRSEGLEGEVDAALGVPRSEHRRRIEGVGVPELCSWFGISESAASIVKRLERGAGVNELDPDQLIDGATDIGCDLLFGDAAAADSTDGADIRS